MTIKNSRLVKKEKPVPTKRIKVCFAGSGGGHLRQLLQLIPIAESYDFYFLTEKTPLGLSVKKEGHPVCFVNHCALGQRKMRGQLSFLLLAVTNFISSLYHFLRHRPDVVISTGAGSAYVTFVLANIFNKKSIYIESIARVSSISQFGKKSIGLVDLYLVQWPSLVDINPNAIYCNPFKSADLPQRTKKDKICVTVGTVLPFDRIVNYVDSLKKKQVITEEIFAQVGDSNISTTTFETSKSVSEADLIAQLEESKIAIVHGGSGSILSALRAGCIVIAIPREAEKGEHYDDHQFELVGELRDNGLLIEATTEEELADAIETARVQTPQTIEINPESYAKHIDDFLENEI